MKVLYIHQYFKTLEEAGGTRSYEFSKHLVDKGYKVVMIAGKNNLDRLIKKVNIDGIEVIYIRNRYSNYMSFKRRIFAFLSFAFLASFISFFIKDIDILYVTSTPLTVGIPALLLNYLKKIPFIFEVRDLWPDVPIELGVIKNKVMIKILFFFERLIYKRAAKIVVLSPGMKMGILKKGISEEKIVLIPNSCDIHRFEAIEDKERIKKIEDIRNDLALPISREDFIVIYIGAVAYANDLKVVVEACKILQYEFNNLKIKVLVIGDGKERPFLEKLKEKYGLYNIFFLGELPKKDVIEIINIAQCGLLVFRNDPILETNSPNKFFDYLAAGKPIVSNVGGWTKEIIENNNIGKVVEGGNPKALAEAMLLMSQKNNFELKEMAIRARKLAEDEFSRLKMAQRFEEILKSVVHEDLKGVQ